MIQTRSKKLECRFCRKLFNRTEHLQRHERIHTKEKPFVCACGKAFTRRDLLLRHERLNHGRDNAASRNQTRLNVPEIASAPADQCELDQNDTALRLPIVETASFAGSSGPDLVQAYVPEAPDTTNGTQHLEPFQLGDDNSLVNDHQLRQSQPYVMDSSAMNVSRDFMDILWDDFNDNLVVDATAGLSTLTDPFTALSASSTAFLDFEDGHSSNAPVEVIVQPIVHPAGPLEYGSRPPSLEREDADLVSSRFTRQAGRTRDGPGSPWRISSEVYNHIHALLEKYRFLYPDSFVLPSKHTMCRYIEGYFSGFHIHLPFLHIPSVSFGTISPELILAILAVGALYRFQRRQSDQLYKAAHALVQHKVQHRTTDLYEHSTTTTLSQSSSVSQIELLQAMILLIALSTWNHSRLLSDSFALAAQLALLTQERNDKNVASTTFQRDWMSWVRRESERRTKLAGYSFLNLHSIVYDIAPKLMTAQVGHVILPSPESHWRAINEPAWLAAQEMEQHHEIDLRTASANLCREQPASEFLGKSTAFGNYFLIHGIVQQIFLCRHSLMDPCPQSGGVLPSDISANIQRTLRNWQQIWDTTNGASVDPASPHGPLSFNSIALFRIALVRLHFDLGPYRGLGSRIPANMAQSLYHSPGLVRSRMACKVVLQLIHALGVIIRIGVEFVAKTQAFSWSIIHPICNLECACFLSKWMLALSDALSNGQELSSSEKYLLHAIYSLLIEADAGSDSGFQNALSLTEVSGANVRRMAVASVRIWAQIFGGANIFDIVDPIGKSLLMYASLLEEEMTHALA